MFAGNMAILEIVSKYPQTEEVFRNYDDNAGCCILCQHLFDTIGDIAGLYGLDVKEIINNLETALMDNIIERNDTCE